MAENNVRRGAGGIRRPAQQPSRSGRKQASGRSTKTSQSGVGRAGRRDGGGPIRRKSKLEAEKARLGFSDVDLYDDDDDERRQRKRNREVLGDDEEFYAGMRGPDAERDLSTVDGEFRAQLAAGLVAANSFTSGSTLVRANAAPVDEGPLGGADGKSKERW